MKIHHYKSCWEAFEKEVIEHEINDLKKNGQWDVLADKIVSEWSVLPDAQKRLLIDALKEAVSHLDSEKDAALLAQITQCFIASPDVTKNLQNNIGEYGAFQKFIGVGKTGNIPHDSRHGVFSEADKMFQSKSISSTDKEQLLTIIPESGAKKLLAYRWGHEGTGGSYPQKYAAGQRLTFAPALKKDSEKEFLQWTLEQAGTLPDEFREMQFANIEHLEESLKIFESMGNFQALLIFLARNADKFPAFCFLNYFLYAWTYTPDLLDCESLVNECTSDFMQSIVRSFAFEDENAKSKLVKMAEEEPEAGVAVYVLNSQKENQAEKDVLLKAVRHGSPVAAFYLVRDFGETNPQIKDLAQRSILSDEYTDFNGKVMEKPFVGCKYTDSVTQIREKIKNQLSIKELDAMNALWKRFIAENTDFEKTSELCQVLHLIAQKRNIKQEDAMIRSAVTGNLDALLDWYDFVKRNGWIVYQKRIREVIRGFHKLTPYQKVRLDLLKLVKG